MDSKIYVVIFQQNEQQKTYLGTTFNYKQAFAIAQNFLSQNPNVESKQMFVNEYFLKNIKKIVDIKN